METRNHCSGAGGGGGERGRERSPGGRRARLTSVFLFRALFISPPPAALLPERALPASGSRRFLSRAGETDEESSAPPRPEPPGGATGGRGPGKGTRRLVLGAWRRLSPPSPPPRQPARPRTPGAAPPALRAARRSREPPGASAPRPGPQLRGPGGPSRAQTFAPVSSALPRHAKPPGARAVARVRTEAPPRGRGIGEAAGFKWGPSGGSGTVCRGGSATSLRRAVDRLGRPPGKVA